MQRPVPVTGEVSQMFRDGLAERGIEELPEQLVTGIDPATCTARLASGGTLRYDLFVGIPVHRAPDPLAYCGSVGSTITADPSQRATLVPLEHVRSGWAPNFGGEHGVVVVEPAAVYERHSSLIATCPT